MKLYRKDIKKYDNLKYTLIKEGLGWLIIPLIVIDFLIKV